MSTTVDERVVEMRFDNKQFEQNIQTSLSSIDKLKHSLNLEGAAKGLESVNTAASRCNMSPLSNAVETVKIKFSAMEVMALTALQNITNSALNAGEKLVSAFTIDPIKSGFQEYETQINAVQTILANTSSKGTTLEQVNNALDELNHYADMTIYNFTEMTRNIGTFTAAGVDLNTSVAAIKGIANLAAVSGSTSQQASTAMYQLSQALAAGTVKLQDWNSVVNAGMGGQVFQDALKETARVHHIAIDELIKDEGSFRETLSKGWLTSDILTETLAKFTGDLNENQLRTMGYTDEQIQSIVKMGQTANDAATKVKTFSQLFDTLKEAAQSGWTQSWEIIVGDFEEAKERLTEVSDIFSGFIGASADRRNAFLESTFSSPLAQIISKLNAAGIETEVFQNKVKELAKNHNVDLDTMIAEEGSFEKALKKAFNDGTLNKSILKDALKSLVGNITGATKSTEEMTNQVEKYGEIVDKVIRGDFGNGEARIKALTDAGYDYATVQNLVNQKLGSSVVHLSSLTDEQLKNADSLAALSDEQLKANGYTEDQIAALHELQDEADKAGSSIDDLINSFDKPSGAELLWDSMLNIIHSVADSLSAVKKAWNDTFHHGMTEDEIIKQRSKAMYNLIQAIHSFTEHLQITDEKADKITRTFKGLFAIIDIITTITGGGLKLAFKGLSLILQSFDLDILDVTATLGDLISGFRDFILRNEYIEKGIKALGNAMQSGCVILKGWLDAFLQLPIVQENIGKLQNAFVETFSSFDNFLNGGINLFNSFIQTIQEWIDAISQMSIVQRNVERFNTAFAEMFSELSVYFGDGIIKINEFIDRVKAVDGITLDNIGAILKDFKDNVFDYFIGITGKFDILGKAIKDFKDDVRKNLLSVGEDFDGLKKKIFDFLKTVKDKFSEHVGLGEILTIGVGASIIVFVKKIGDALEALSGPFKSISDILSGFDTLLGSCSTAINAFATKTKSQALMNVAISIGILAASIVALTLVDQSKLWSAVSALGALSLGLLAVSAAMETISKVSGVKGSASMLGIAASLLILVKTLKSMEGLDHEQIWQNIGILGVMASGLAIVAGLLGKFAPQLSKGAITLIGISVALRIMVGVLKDIDSLTLDNIGRSIKILIGAMGGLVALAIICKNIKMGSAVGILAMVVALKLFVGVFDDIINLDAAKIKNSMDTLITIFGAFAALMISSKFAGANAAKGGIGILAISAALLLLTGTIKILAKIDNGDLKKGTNAIAKILTLFAGVIAASNFAGKNAAKAGVGLLAMSGAILLLSGAIIILSHIKSDGLDQALKAIAKLELLFAGLIVATHFAKDCKSTLVIISATIGLLAVAIGTLSMINQENLASATNALSQVMLVFSILITSTHLAKKANGTLIIMVGAVTILAGIIALLSGLPAESVLGVSTALSTLLLSLSASMFIISNTGTVAPGAYVTLGVMTLIVAGLAAIVGVLAYTKVGGVLEIAEGLSVLLLSLSASCLILSAVGVTGAAAFVGIGALTTLITAVGGLMLGIGALATYYPGMEEFLDKGLSILEKIGYGLGSFFGKIVGGFLASSTAGLVEVGSNLAAFIENASPFFDTVSNFDDGVLSGVKALAETILILTAADVLQGITSWFTGGSSLTKFGVQLVPFGLAIKAFSIAVQGVDTNSIVNAAAAGKALTDFANSIPNTGGIVSLFTGNNDIGKFGVQLVPFGLAIKAFSIAVQGVDTNSIVNAATAGKALTDFANSIPNAGGIASLFAGNNDIGKFGVQLVPFGLAIKAFSIAVQGIDTNSIVNAAAAGKALTDFANSIPNTGGIASLFTGDNDIGKFGNQLIRFGLAIKAFSVAVKGIDTNSIVNAATAGKALTDFANSIPNTGGIVSLFTGDNDIGTFGYNLVAFGNGIKKYSDSVSGIDISAMSSSITQINRLVETAKNMSELDTSGMSGFGTALIRLGNDGIYGFINAFTNANGRVSSAASSMLTTFINAANAKKGNLLSAFSGMMQNVLGVFSNHRPQFGSSGSSLISEFTKGVVSAGGETKTAIDNIINTCLSVFKTNGNSSCLDAGKNMMLGFIKGIKSKFGDIVKAAKDTVSGAVDSIKEFLGIHSPSTLMAELGEYSGEGYEEGLLSTEPAVEDAGEDVAESAYSGMEKGSKKGLENFRSSMTEEEKKSLLERSQYWTNLINVVDAGVEKKNSTEQKAVQDSKVINNQNAQINNERIQQEESYWARLLAEKQKGAEAEKYQSMSMVDFRRSIVEQSIDILKNYTDTLKSTTDSMMNDSSMFTDVLTSSDLTKKLNEQISEMEEYKTVITSLNERIADGGLKDAINKMGVDSLDELKLINGMTDDELSNYVSLYDQKYALCQEAAAVQLSGLQTETETKLSELYGGAQVNLQTFAQSFDGTFESIRGYVGQSVEIGGQIASGVAEGITQNTASTEDAAKQMIDETEQAAKDAADIHSPSGLFRDEVGSYITQGVAEGMVDETAKASLKSSADEVMDYVVQSFTESDSKDKFTQVGTDIVDACKDGITQQEGALSTQCGDTMTAALTEMQNAVINFKPTLQSNGSDLVSSFIAGVNSQNLNVTNTFTTIIQGILNAITAKKTEFYTMGSSLVAEFVKGINAEDENAKSAFINIISACLTTIKNKYYEFQSTGETVMTNFIGGVKAKEYETKSAFSAIVDSSIEEIRSNYERFHQAGAYLVEGFANGITENTFMAEAKARAMARAAADAAEDELDEHSPSRVGYHIGDFFGLGFVNAIGTYGVKAYNASADMAKSAKTGLQDAIAKVIDMMDENIDYQPTIRPVLDLSEVESKSHKLNTLFSRTQAITLGGSINASKAHENQNGDSGLNGGNSYKFIQNNYSPKALSRTEIYRQTKNQFSAMERMVET
nr:MAG TPA: tail tape measure [Caudoviricetes sp.]